MTGQHEPLRKPEITQLYTKFVY